MKQQKSHRERGKYQFDQLVFFYVKSLVILNTLWQYLITVRRNQAPPRRLTEEGIGMPIRHELWMPPEPQPSLAAIREPSSSSNDRSVGIPPRQQTYFGYHDANISDFAD